MKKEKNKLALITLGSILAIGTPSIIIGSIFIYNQSKTPIALTNLNNFYNNEAGSLFQSSNFKISAPMPTEGKYLAENVETNNISFSKIENLKNYAYNIEITKVIPNISEASLQFEYIIFPYNDKNIQKTVRSESYFGYTDDLKVYHPFSKK